MSALPLMLEGSAIEALVVGGGAVAARKALALLAAGARVRVVAPRVDASLRAAEREIEAGALRIDERPYASADIGEALLVVAATDSRDANACVARDARAARRLVNVADAPEEGNCTMPATHRAGPLVVAVAAGGVPTVAARVRDALAGRFDARYGEAAAALGALRRRLLDERGSDAWHEALEALAGADFCESVESGRFAERMEPWR